MAQGASLNGQSQPVYITDVLGNPTTILAGANQSGGSGSGTDLDTNGDPVPTYKAHTYSYDTSGNLLTDTVTDGTNTWVRSSAYSGGVQTSDSGWVKQ